MHVHSFTSSHIYTGARAHILLIYIWVDVIFQSTIRCVGLAPADEFSIATSC